MEYNIPILLEEHALIRISHCGISQMDLETFLGREPKVMPPRVLGTEICGTVVKVNPPDGYKELIGAHVVVDPVITCRECTECLNGYSNHCEKLEIVGFTRDGGFTEYVCVPVQNLHPIRDIDDMECFTLATDLASAFHLDSIATLPSAGHCVILGSRPFDIFYGLILDKKGGLKVDIADNNSFRLNIAQSLGLSCIDLQNTNLNGIIGETFSKYGKGSDVVVVGSSKIQGAISLGIELVRPKGQIFLTGNLQNYERPEFGNLIEKEVACTCTKLYTKKDFERSVDDIVRYANDYYSLITHRLPLTRVSDGLRILESVEESMQVLIMDNIN